MSDRFAEVAILEDLNSLPARMQRIYLQLVSAIDNSIQRLKATGANPEQLSETFIETLVEKMLKQGLSQEAVDELVEDEFLRQILISSELGTLS